MYCPNCGTKNNDSAKFCPTCGAQLGSASADRAVSLSNITGNANKALGKLTETLKALDKRVKLIACASVAVVILAIVIICLVSSGSDTNIPVSPAEDFLYEYDDGGIIITRYIGEEQKVHIPDQIDGRAVTEIDEEAFSGCISITHVIIPDTVNELGAYCFSGCTSLVSVTLPTPEAHKEDGKEYYEFEYAVSAFCFSDCTSLEKIEIPAGVDEISREAFKNCTSLKTIDLPDSLESIGDDAFNGCTSLKSITLPNGISEIGSAAFKGCTSISKIEIPDSVKSIEGHAFGGTSITVYAPHSTSYYENNAIAQYESHGHNYNSYLYSSLFQIIGDDDDITWVVTE